MKKLLLASVIVATSFACGKKEKYLTVEEVGRRSIIETVSASGKIQPEIEVKITSEVSGQIIELPVKEGEVVQKGDLLVRINPDIYEAARNRATASLNTARSNLANAKARIAQASAQAEVAQLNYDRNKSLFEKGAISAAEWDNARSQYQVAMAEVEAAEQSANSAEFAIQSASASVKEANDNLRRTTIIAPQDGTVTALTKELGEMVLGNQMMAGETIMKISQLGIMEVNVEVNESDIVRVSLGDTARVEVDAYQDEIFNGVVTEIGNTALNALNGLSLSMDQVTNFSVKVRILAESYTDLCKGDPSCVPFRPGMSATVEIETEHASDVIAVPIRAVTTREDTTGASTEFERFKAKRDAEKAGESVEDMEPSIVVFVVPDGSSEASLRVVETGVSDSRYIEIKTGVDAGEVVITGPYVEVSKNLENGKEVKVRKEGDSEDSEEAE